MTPRIENWQHIVQPMRTRDSRLRSNYIVGNVYDDPRYPDGEKIMTGTIIVLDLPNKQAQTRRTTYALGEPQQ